jgi:hypothetical protein
LVWIRKGLFFVLLWACGTDGGPQTGVVEFSPNPAPLAGGVCTSEARIVNITGRSSSLLALTARFTDASGGDVSFSYGVEELAALLPGQNVVLPAKGALVAPLSFDLGAAGLTSPAEGVVVMAGGGTSGVVQFVGSLRCE